MRLGTLLPFGAWEKVPVLQDQGMEFLEILAPDTPTPDFKPPQLAPLPLIWQCPPQLPAEHPDPYIRAGVLQSYLLHLQMAKQMGALLMVVQFHRPRELRDKNAFIRQTVALLAPLTEQARQQGVQVVLRNSPDNRDQLQLLREVMRGVAGLGLALDMAHAQHLVVKNLSPEYLWDSDLSARLAHVYVSDSNTAELRLPLGALGQPDWPKLVRPLKERYNASITLDIGNAALPYLALSRAQWLAWWED